jgi:hypothetical protein
MSTLVRAQPFPGGVADADLQYALWRSRSGQVVALRLADGQVLWRSAEPLWPLLLGHGLALGLAPSPVRVVALAFQGEGAGSERWRSNALPWPDGAPAPSGNAASTLHAAWLGSQILLRWQLRPLYAGGAAPGPSRAQPAAGSCLLDATTGALQSAPADIDGPAGQTLPQLPSDNPSVLAQALLGGVTYRLQRHPLAGDMAQTVLIAHDTQRGLDLWSSALEETRTPKPRALRS